MTSMNSDANSGRKRPSSSSRPWPRAGPRPLQSFQGMDLGDAGASCMPADGHAARDQFAPDKLQALQQQYLQDAGAALEPAACRPTAGQRDRRFAAEAWADNPVAAFAAAAYLLNARTLMGLADAVRGRRQDPRPHALCRRAVDGRRGAQQLHGASMPKRRRRPSRPRARASPRACRTCCTTCSRAMCR